MLYLSYCTFPHNPPHPLFLIFSQPSHPLPFILSLSHGWETGKVKFQISPLGGAASRDLVFTTGCMRCAHGGGRKLKFPRQSTYIGKTGLGDRWLLAFICTRGHAKKKGNFKGTAQRDCIKELYFNPCGIKNEPRLFYRSIKAKINSYNTVVSAEYN